MEHPIAIGINWQSNPSFQPQCLGLNMIKPCPNPEVQGGISPFYPKILAKYGKIPSNCAEWIPYVAALLAVNLAFFLDHGRKGDGHPFASVCHPSYFSSIVARFPPWLCHMCRGQKMVGIRYGHPTMETPFPTGQFAQCTLYIPVASGKLTRVCCLIWNITFNGAWQNMYTKRQALKLGLLIAGYITPWSCFRFPF